jgi:hypothetical protein
MSNMETADEVERFWRCEYAAAFHKKSPEDYADTFALPCIINVDDLPRTVFTDRDELIEFCTKLIRKATDTSWNTSSIDSFAVSVLDENVALVRVEASRFDIDGKQISRLYGSYTINKDGGRWKMAAVFGGFLR